MIVDGIRHPVLPAAHVARQHGVKLETVYRAIRKGVLHGYQVGAAWLVMNDATLAGWQPLPPGRPREKQARPRRSAVLKEKQR